jgi:hypothetical protein
MYTVKNEKLVCDTCLSIFSDLSNFKIHYRDNHLDFGYEVIETSDIYGYAVYLRDNHDLIQFCEYKFCGEQDFIGIKETHFYSQDFHYMNIPKAGWYIISVEEDRDGYERWVHITDMEKYKSRLERNLSAISKFF